MCIAGSCCRSAVRWLHVGRMLFLLPTFVGIGEVDSNKVFVQTPAYEVLRFFSNIFSRHASDAAANDRARSPRTGPEETNNDSVFNDNIIFSPAEHTDTVEKRKERRKRARQQKRLQQQQKQINEQYYQHNIASHKTIQIIQPTHEPHSRTSTPQNCNSSFGSNNPPSTTSTSASSAPSTPSRSERPPKAVSPGKECPLVDEEDVWYAKWWMFCFPDAVKNMTTKR